MESLTKKHFFIVLFVMFLSTGKSLILRRSNSLPRATYRHQCTTQDNDGDDVSEVLGIDDKDLSAAMKWKAGDVVFPSKYMPSKEDLRNFEQLRKRSQANNQLNWINTLNVEELDRGITQLEKYTTKERQTKLQRVLDGRSDHIQFVFENPSNSNNIWAALRSFDSFGVQNSTVIIEESMYDGSWRREVMGTAMGAQKWLSLREEGSTRDALMRLKSDGFKIVVSDIHESSKSVHEIDWRTQKCAVVMGNEESGCSAVAKELADETFFIPMKGFAESLNLSVACAVICTVLDSKGALTPNLKEVERKRLYLLWMARTIGKNSVSILRQGAGLQIEQGKLYETIGGFSQKP